MTTKLYNSNHLEIIPYTTAEYIELNDGTKIQDKIENIDTTLVTLNTDIEGINTNIDGINTDIVNLRNDINNYVGKIPEGLNTAFKSIIFKRQEDKPNKPESTEGDYNNPVPEGWSDGIPNGEFIVWMTSRIFSSDGKEPQQEEWEEVAQMTDTNSFDVEFSSIITNPGNPSDNPDNWSNEADETTVWMATRQGSNGTWEGWQISKIKGENGKDGTSIKIAGKYNTEELLKQEYPEGPKNDSDSYIIDGNLYVWDGDSWENVGLFQGDSAYVHIKYANLAKENDGLKFTINGITLTPTSGNGETPGNYIGILVDNIKDDSIDWKTYTWTKWKGEDGWGYEYIYTLGYEAPIIPTDEINPDGKVFLDDDFVPDLWSDNPLSPNEKNGHCWICTRQKVDGVWQSFKGDPHNSGYASLYTKYTKDGKDGKDAVNLPIITGLESNIIIPCDSEGGLITEGTHFGAGNDETSFKLYIYLNPKLIIGSEDVTENCTWTFKGDIAFNNEIAAYQNEYLLIEEESEPWSCTITGIVKNSRQGRITITATYKEKNITAEVIITKAYSGKKGETGDSATFTYYELNSNVNEVIAKIGANGELKSLTPSNLVIKVFKFTESGKEEATEIPSTYSFDISCCDINDENIWTYSSYECGLELDITKNPETNEVYTKIPRYFYIDLIDSGSTVIDFQRISVLYEYEVVSVNIPDWVNEWDGLKAEINNNTVLTGKLYAGAKPTNEEDWTGVLIGNEVAEVKGLPGMISEESKNFSGILGLTNGNLNKANEAEVSFALDAETGNAYFKGEVHATSGTIDSLTTNSDNEGVKVVYGEGSEYNDNGSGWLYKVFDALINTKVEGDLDDLWESYATISAAKSPSYNGGSVLIKTTNNQNHNTTISLDSEIAYTFNNGSTTNSIKFDKEGITISNTYASQSSSLLIPFGILASKLGSYKMVIDSNNFVKIELTT